MKMIQVLGPGCAKCQTLAANAEAAVRAAGLSVAIQKVSDLHEIMTFGVMTTPALVVDGKVVSAGRVLSAAEIGRFLT